MNTQAKRLRSLLATDDTLVCPGVVSPLFGKMAEDAGFQLIYATGAGIANAIYGLPDLGLLGMQEILDVTARIARNCSIPLIADIDTGYGGTLNVVRTIQEFERAGVAGIQIEDQLQPKRCGHFDGTQVVSTGEMLERVTAAAEARQDSDLVIIARTDALATEGIDAAVERARAYAAAGADLVFVEAPTSVEQLARIPQEMPVPVVVNMVEGGRTPLLPLKSLNEMGYKIALYANASLRSAMAATRRTFATLYETGSTAEVETEIVSWQDRQAAVKLNDWLQLDARIASKSAADSLLKRAAKSSTEGSGA